MKIKDAKRLAKDYDLRRCVILFETSAGRVGYASYGRTKKLYDETGVIMDEFFDALEDRIHKDG